MRLLIVANPCFGLDVKAVAETRADHGRRNAGAAVLLISEDLDEILELSDRVAVMHEGGRPRNVRRRVPTPRKLAVTCLYHRYRPAKTPDLCRRHPVMSMEIGTHAWRNEGRTEVTGASIPRRSV